MEEKQTILAAGAGASTKFVSDHGNRIERVENVKDVNQYIQRIDEMLERKRIGIDNWRNQCGYSGKICESEASVAVQS